jgi:hypothetical protein
VTAVAAVTARPHREDDDEDWGAVREPLPGYGRDQRHLAATLVPPTMCGEGALP